MILVTGGSGFIGSYCILQLLEQGHQVRTTVRALDRDVPAGVEKVKADLNADAGWREAVEGCEYVLHVASPFPGGVPKHEDDLIVPAREGTLRVLKAARDAGSVKRVVLTSSFAAIGYGQHKPPGYTFTEQDWTDLTAPGLTAYVKSKTLAERAAWDFIKANPRLELTAVNPVAVMGPVLGPDYANSIDLVRRMMDGGMPGSPNLMFGIVDVRDVADLHLRAMIAPAANGQRFLCCAGDFMSVHQVATVLKQALGEKDSAKIATRILPDWLIRLGAVLNKEARQILPELGKIKNGSSAKAIRMLDWKPRPATQSLIDTALSLKQLR